MGRSNQDQQLKKILDGKVQFTPEIAVTIAQNATGQTLISVNKPLVLGVILDLLLQALNQTWFQMRKQDSMIVRPGHAAEPVTVQTEGNHGAS